MNDFRLEKEAPRSARSDSRLLWRYAKDGSSAIPLIVSTRLRSDYRARRSVINTISPVFKFLAYFV